MAPRVLLLRTPATPLESDRYEAALTRASFRPLSLPVLETTLENLEHLSRIVRGEDDEGTVDGVIVTSARAVDACANAGADIDWRAMRFYVVGPATAAALLARLPNPPEDLRGTKSGNAEELARYIVHDTTREERLLYLTGDKNRETLSRIVQEGLGEGVLRELRVYATRGVSDFESSLTGALEGVTDYDEPWWIVFFAPSTATHAMPALRKRFSMGLDESSPRRARLAAIGPTTAKSIREDAGFEVDAVADEPNADSLVLSLLGAK